MEQKSKSNVILLILSCLFIFSTTINFNNLMNTNSSFDNSTGTLTNSSKLRVADENNYNKVKAVMVNSSYNVSNYQLRLNISYDPNMNTDFSDIRFMNRNNTVELPYWIEEKSDGNWALVWVKSDYINTNNGTQLYLYFDNPDATSKSNGTDTFIFFDDFEQAVLDTNVWEVIEQIGTVSYTVENSNLKLLANAVGNHWMRVRTKNFVTSGYNIALYEKTSAPGNDNWVSTILRDNISDYIIGAAHGNENSDSTRRWWAGSNTITDFPNVNDSNYHIISYKYTESNFTFEDLTTGTKRSSPNPGINKEGKIDFGAGDGATKDNRLFVDWVFIVKNMDLEPTVLIQNYLEIKFNTTLQYLNTTQPVETDLGLQINCTVLSSSTLQWVYLSENSTGLFINRTMNLGTSGEWSYIVNISELNKWDNLTFLFYANDSYGNIEKNDNKGLNFSILIKFLDQSTPIVDGDEVDGGEDLPIVIIIIIIIGAIVGVSIAGAYSVIKKKNPSPKQFLREQISEYESINGNSENLLKNEEKTADGLKRIAFEKKERLLKPKFLEKTQNVKSEIPKIPKKIKKKAFEVIPAPIKLTEAEKAELAKTESEVDVDEQKFICIVHRGSIYGAEIYLCKHCKTFYCQRCAKVLKLKGERCWTCNNEIEIMITQQDRKELLEKKVIDLIDEIINEKEFLKEFIETNKGLEDLPQIKDYIFSMLTIEDIDRMDLLKLSIDDKKQFIKEYLTLDIKERKAYLEEILKK